MSTQITLGLPGFPAEVEGERKARIEMRHFSRHGHKLRGVELRDGRLTGHDGSNREHEVARSVAYDVNGSRHRCNSSCQHAKGADCECSCGGANHGKARLSGILTFNLI